MFGKGDTELTDTSTLAFIPVSHPSSEISCDDAFYVFLGLLRKWDKCLKKERQGCTVGQGDTEGEGLGRWLTRELQGVDQGATGGRKEAEMECKQTQRGGTRRERMGWPLLYESSQGKALAFMPYLLGCFVKQYAGLDKSLV